VCVTEQKPFAWHVSGASVKAGSPLAFSLRDAPNVRSNSRFAGCTRL
jgi:hypothetical protein